MSGKRQHSNEKLLNELHRLARKLNRAPLKRDMDKYGNHSARTYQLRFGSWSEAIEEAGYQPRKKGENYDKRPAACPLCGIEQGGLDFHHWRYGDNKIGCYLCRDCHDDVHHGKANKDENTDWLVHAVENLVELHTENHGQDTDMEEILNRYNLPNVGPIVEQALAD